MVSSYGYRPQNCLVILSTIPLVLIPRKGRKLTVVAKQFARGLALGLWVRAGSPTHPLGSRVVRKSRIIMKKKPIAWADRERTVREAWVLIRAR